MSDEPVLVTVAVERLTLMGRGPVIVVVLDRDCADFTWLMGKIAEVDGVRYLVSSVESFCLNRHHKGERIGLLVSEAA